MEKEISKSDSSFARFHSEAEKEITLVRDIRFIRVIRGRKIGLELCSLIPALGFAASLVEELRSPILSPRRSESVPVGRAEN